MFPKFAEYVAEQPVFNHFIYHELSNFLVFYKVCN
jgi:hypothetical protein